MTDNIPIPLNRAEYRAFVSALDNLLGGFKKRIEDYYIEEVHGEPKELSAGADGDTYVQYHILEKFTAELNILAKVETVWTNQIEKLFQKAFENTKESLATDPQIDAMMDSSEVLSHNRTPFLADSDPSDYWRKLIEPMIEPMIESIIKKPTITLG